MVVKLISKTSSCIRPIERERFEFGVPPYCQILTATQIHPSGSYAADTFNQNDKCSWFIAYAHNITS